MLRDEPEDKPFDVDDPKTAPFGACCVCGRGAWSALHTADGIAMLCAHEACGGSVSGSEVERSVQVRALKQMRGAA